MYHDSQNRKDADREQDELLQEKGTVDLTPPGTETAHDGEFVQAMAGQQIREDETDDPGNHQHDGHHQVHKEYMLLEWIRTASERALSSITTESRFWLIVPTWL